jgi:hypothetical protein
MKTSIARLLALAALAPIPACDGCGRSEKPYTPFGVASALPTTSASSGVTDAEASEPIADAGTPAFTPRPALSAPAGATRWTLDGRALDAPAERAFALGLVADFDADGQNEIVAWTVPRVANAPRQAPGELWLFPTAGAPKKLTALPGFVPSGPACRHVPSLALTGPHSVTLDVSAECTATLLPRAPVRALSVLSPLAARPLLVTLRVAKPAAGDPFTLSVDSSDFDNDGRDDARVVVTQKPGCRGVTGACDPEPLERDVSASIVWLDRAAGTSRETSEPSASIARAAALELGRSKRKKLAPSVLGTVRNVRRLVSTLCAEGGVPRILEEDGSMIRCAPLAVTVDRLLTAEVQAALAMGDLQAATGALDRDGFYFASVSDKRRAGLEKAVLKAATVIELGPLSTPPVHPLPAAKEPRLSPLAFEADGTLLAQTKSDLVRLAVPYSSGEPTDPEAGIAAWPLELRTASGKRLAQLVPSCDQSEVVLGLDDPSLAGPRLPLLAPRPGACAGKPAPKLPLVPLSIGKDDFGLVVAGQRVEARSTPATGGRGTARSPDGHSDVVPTSLGLLVTTNGKAELWRGSVSDARRYSDCVVANGARAVACVESGSLVIAQRP